MKTLKRNYFVRLQFGYCFLLVFCLLVGMAAPMVALDFPETIQDIRRLYLSDKLEEAKTLAVDYLNDNPQDPEALLWRGKIAFILREEKPTEYFTRLGDLGEKAIPVLLYYINDLDARIRVQIYFQLARIDDPRKVNAFLEHYYKEKDEAPREVMLMSMGFCDDKRITETLFWTLSNDRLRPSARRASVIALANIAGRGDTLAILTRMTSYFDNAPILRMALPFLEDSAIKIGKDHPEVLVQFLQNSSPDKSKEDDLASDSYSMISQAVYKTGKTFTPYLLKIYQEEQSSRKYHLLRIISRIEDDPEIVEFLVGELKNQDPQIVRQALLGLNNFDSEKAIQAVGEFIDQPQHQTTALRILAFKENIGSYEEKFAELLNDEDNHKRLAALRAMVTIDAGKYNSLFADVLKNDKNPTARSIALQGLGSSLDPLYIPVLTEYLNSSSATLSEQQEIIQILRNGYYASVIQKKDMTYQVIPHAPAKKD